MDRIIEGSVYVVGDNIDTDQIIPAHYLTYNPADPQERKQLGRQAFSGLPAGRAGLPDGKIPFVDTSQPDTTTSRFAIVIAGSNFGCGSSREHAPLALAEAGARAVVATSYARIFFRNAVNGGYLIPLESADRLVESFATGQQARVDLSAHTITNLATGQRHALKPLGAVAPIIEAGGLFAYAKSVGMLGT
jgi:3-isopropylmalate/(R)-2-methylmalate dehydratase small subunit